jgi:hypothetical protein
MQQKKRIEITREHLTDKRERFCFAFTIKQQQRNIQNIKINRSNDVFKSWAMNAKLTSNKKKIQQKFSTQGRRNDVHK